MYLSPTFAKLLFMEITIYSKMSDCAEYRLAHWDAPNVGPTWTGTVEARDLEDIFRLFNRVDLTDSMRLEDIGYTLPSLSVGDVVIVDGNHHIVAFFGFAPISADEYEDYRKISPNDYTAYRQAVRDLSQREVAA